MRASARCGRTDRRYHPVMKPTRPFRRRGTLRSIAWCAALLGAACGRPGATGQSPPSQDAPAGTAAPPASPPATTPPGPPDEPGKGQPPPRQVNLADVPWAVRPGLRIASLRARVPTVDRVVLVPDELTYLEAISEWSLAGRWPVLFDDDVYAPMFIRRFAPAEVIRKPASEATMPRGAELEAALLNIVAAAWWSGQIDETSLDSSKAPPEAPAAFAAADWTPPGVVITSIRDAAWPAALALAADRGQPLAFLDDRFGTPNGSVSLEDWPRLRTAVESLVAASGYPYRDLGDAIDTVTIVRDLPVKYVTTDDPNGNSRNATTDGLGRHADDSRWAIVGSIFGDGPRAVYMAMCSIFLQPQSALLFDTYPDLAVWSRYSMDKPAARFREVGFDVVHTAAPASTAAAWEYLAPGGLERDLIFVNTKGNQNWFDAADERRVFVHDVPILNSPAVVHFIHSWSCIAPANRNTLAGRWLERGAYAYVGSVHEPTLAAFVTPDLLTERLLSSVPYLIAARVWELKPWRVATIGDPLMTLLRPAPRAARESRPTTGESLRDALRRETPLAEASGDWSKVLRLINLLGLDPLAADLYDQRLSNHAHGETIAEALGPLFRTRDAATLFAAVEQIPAAQLSPARKDLLWLKWLPALGSIDDPARLHLLRAHIREPLGYVDACRLAAVMKRLGRRDEIDAMLNQYEADVKDGYSRQLVRRARPQ